MSNEEVTEFLKQAQRFWKKWKDDAPYMNDGDRIDTMIREAGNVVDGLPEHARYLMMFFAEELSARIRAKEDDNGRTANNA